MNIFKKSDNNLDELVFENRNKAYGAYVLRSNYNKNLKRSFLITFLVPLSLVIFSVIFNKLNGNNRHEKPKEKETDSLIIFVYEAPKKELLKEIEKAFTKPPSVKGNNINYTIKRNDQVKEIKTDSIFVAKTIEGLLNPIGNNNLPIGKGNEGPIVDANEGNVFDGTNVELMPEFNGDLYDYLSTELHYPKVALENNVTGKVLISFVIDKNGEIGEIEVLRKVGFGCDEEAMRVIKNMPKWNPGQQNKRKVNVRMLIPIVFEVND
ncbi:MAG: energy transducer TonB [Bacteroidota bacterium]